MIAFEWRDAERAVNGGGRYSTDGKEWYSIPRELSEHIESLIINHRSDTEHYKRVKLRIEPTLRYWLAKRVEAFCNWLDPFKR